MKALAGLVLALVLGGVALLAGGGPEECRAQGAAGDVEPRSVCPGSTPASAPPAACATTAAFARVAAAPAGRRVRLSFARRVQAPVTVEVFQSSIGRRIIGNRRIARFANRSRSLTWNGLRARNGLLFVRFRAAGDVRRVVLERRRGRFLRRPDFQRRDSCGALTQFKLGAPVFGGRTNRALGIAYRVASTARVTVMVTRGGRTVKRFATRTDRVGQTYRLRLASERFARGSYVVRVAVAPDGGAAVSARLTARRL